MMEIIETCEIYNNALSHMKADLSALYTAIEGHHDKAMEPMMKKIESKQKDIKSLCKQLRRDLKSLTLWIRDLHTDINEAQVLLVLPNLALEEKDGGDVIGSGEAVDPSMAELEKAELDETVGDNTGATGEVAIPAWVQHWQARLYDGCMAQFKKDESDKTVVEDMNATGEVVEPSMAEFEKAKSDETVLRDNTVAPREEVPDKTVRDNTVAPRKVVPDETVRDNIVAPRKVVPDKTVRDNAVAPREVIPAWMQRMEAKLCKAYSSTYFGVYKMTYLEA